MVIFKMTVYSYYFADAGLYLYAVAGTPQFIFLKVFLKLVIMKTPIKTLYLSLLVIAGLQFAACSKDKDEPGPDPNPTGEKTFKFTLKTSGLQSADNFSVSFTGGDIQGTATTMFKINGAVQSNKKSIEISKEQLIAGNVVIESTIPLATVLVSASGFSGTTGHSFTFTMEPVINNQPQTTVNKTITTSVYAESLSY